ncbi:MAG: TolC family protein, partial [Gammaproteobacteria bacterium]|nr:TolC family protein [Gammaproteobacteria bacterium]
MCICRGSLVHRVVTRVFTVNPVKRGLHLALLCLLLAPVAASANPTEPLSLTDVESLALSAEPGHQALLARAEATSDLSVAAGALPDPQLRAGILNFPVDSGGFTTEGMSQVQVGVRQAFPAGRTRALTTQQLEVATEEIRAQAQARERDVQTAVRHAWLNTYYWDEAQRIVSDSRPFFSDLVRITQSLYAVGKKNQQELLRAELELSRLDDRLLVINKRQVASRATLSEWIGEHHAQRPLASDLPNWVSMPSFEAMKIRLTEHPQLQAAEDRVKSQTVGVDLAKQKYKPSWAIDLNYGLRDGQLPNGDPRSDFLSGMLTFDLPVFTKNRQDRQLSSAKHLHRA